MRQKKYLSALIKKTCHPIFPKLLLVTAAFIDSAIVLSAIISWNYRMSELSFKNIEIQKVVEEM